MMTINNCSLFWETGNCTIRKYWQLGSIALALLLLSIIPIRLAQAFEQVPSPQAVLTLGGGIGREEAAAKLGAHHPNMDIWVSSGSLLPHEAHDLFQEFGVSQSRLRLDYRASDTVTNFTTLVDDFERLNIRHVYIVTSDFHMPRAKAIASIVLGSRGIAFTAVPIPSDRSQESTLKILRDSSRCLFWILTGQTGASLKNLSYL